MGRGVEATSTMAQMRSAIRTLIAIDPDPEAVMRGLDRVFERWHLEQLVTVVYGIVDSDRGEVSIINAGHPQPLLVHADGEVEVITTLADPDPRCGRRHAHGRDAYPSRPTRPCSSTATA